MKRFASILRLVITRSTFGSITAIPLPASNNDKLTEILTRAADPITGVWDDDRAIRVGVTAITTWYHDQTF